MSISHNIQKIKSEILAGVKLVAVTKTYPADIVMQAYNAGHKIFGENKVQELVKKYEELPKDIEWHLIGHLQTNKVKYIAPFVNMIHSVESLKLLQEINKCAAKANRIIDCLLQIHIAQEETKFGMSFDEADAFLRSAEIKQLENIRIVGLMGMATLTDDKNKIRNEFRSLKNFYAAHCQPQTVNCQFSILSMGMSSDYKIAIEEGSNMIRVGSSIFGNRK